MITKTTTPIIETIGMKDVATGLTVEYRFFGILFYKKTSYSPVRYGVEEFNLPIP